MQAGDDSLIQRWRRGDRSAFEQIVRRYDARILNLAYRLTTDAEEAKDIRQQTFLRAFRSPAGFNGTGSLDAWLYRIVLNLCRDGERRRRQARTLLERVRRHPPGWSPPSSQSVEQAEIGERVAAAVRELPATEREVLVLRQYQDLTFLAIAGLLEVPVTTVKSRMARALERLRWRLQDLSIPQPQTEAVDEL